MRLRVWTTSTIIALGLSLTNVAAALTPGVAVDDATEKQRDNAKKSYIEGIEALDAGDNEKALELFTLSYGTVASPNSQLMVGRVLVKLGRQTEAYREFAAVLEKAKRLAETEEKYAATAEAAQKEIDDLSSKLAFVKVQPGTRVSIDDREIPSGDIGAPLPYEPGTVTVAMTHSDGSQSSTELTLAAGQTSELTAAPPPKSEPPPAPPPPPVVKQEGVPKRTLAYVSGAIGVVGLATFGAFTYLHDPARNREGCTQGFCPETTISNAKVSGAYQSLAFAGLGIGVVGLGTGAYLFFSSEPATEEQTPPGPSASVAVGPSSVMVHGTF